MPPLHRARNKLLLPPRLYPPERTATIGRGDTKISIRIDDAFQVDMRCVADDQFGSALQLDGFLGPESWDAGHLDHDFGHLFLEWFELRQKMRTLEFDKSLRAMEATRKPTHPLRLELHSYFFTQALAGPRRGWLLAGFLHAMVWISLVVLPFLIMLFTQVVFLPYHDYFITRPSCIFCGKRAPLNRSGCIHGRVMRYAAKDNCARMTALGAGRGVAGDWETKYGVRRSGE